MAHFPRAALEPRTAGGALMDPVLAAIAVVLLIVANGWFVLGEFAFVAADRTALADAAERGDRRAGSALAVHRRLSFMLSGAQLGITLTSLLVGAIAEPLFRGLLAGPLAAAPIPPGTSVALAVGTGLVLSTAVQMVFGELAPKNLGIAQPERFALGVAGGLRGYLAVASPVIRLFDGSANALLRRVGVEPADEPEPGVEPAELARIVGESEQSGALTEGQAELLGRALAFRERRTAAAMVPAPQVRTVSADSSCATLQQLAVATGHSRFPVVGAGGLDDVLGVVQVKDVLCVPVAERAAVSVRTLTSAPVVVPESTGLEALMAELRRGQSPLALVVDEHGATAGIISLEDGVEELVGEIRDEHDPEEPRVVAQPGGAFLVPGSWRPDEVQRDTGVTLPEGDYETVSGLVMDALGRVPAPGDVVEVDGVTVRVVRVDGHAVGRVWLAEAQR